MAAIFEQFVVFGTDNAGIERSLRFVQAACLFLTSYPIPIMIPLPISVSPPATNAIVRTNLSQLHDRINVTRRLLRFFRFLEYFQSGWLLYQSGCNSIDTWLDVLGKSCLGIFGMLESATLFDLLQLECFEFFGAQQTIDLNYQAQLFWIIALNTSILSSGIKMIRTYYYHRAPKIGPGSTSSIVQKKDAYEDKREEHAMNPGKYEGLNKSMEQDEMQSMNAARRLDNRRNEEKECTEQTSNLFMRIIADGLDLILPAAAVKWIGVEKWVIGMVMMTTTILTIHETWDKCGRELRYRRCK